MGAECAECYLKHMRARTGNDELIAWAREQFDACTDPRDRPVIAARVRARERDEFGICDDHADAKRYFNSVMLDIAPDLVTDDIERAMLYARQCNYIDFGTVTDVNERELLRLLHEADSQSLPQDTFGRFMADLERAETLTLACDNCGEIVADKLLLHCIGARYPKLRLTAVVRGYPVINDATMEDAEQVGLAGVAKVIANGSDIAGNHWKHISAEAREAFRTADIVISKGQGNFETLRGCGLNAYYLLLCKCALFERYLKLPRMSGVFLHESQLPADFGE